MTDLPLIRNPRPPTGAARVHGVILGAGISTRFGGSNKLIAPVDGEPMVRRAARTLVDADLSKVTVVVGYQASEVEAAVGGLGVETVHNADYRDGQASSVRVGFRTARSAGADAVIVALGDMPDVSPATIRALVAAYENGSGTALAAAHDGDRGNPVLFDRRHFDNLSDIEGDTGGRSILLAAEEAALIEVDDPGVRRDIDTQAEYDQR